MVCLHPRFAWKPSVISAIQVVFFIVISYCSIAHLSDDVR